MKTVWINKVRKREVKSGYKILSLEIPDDEAGGVKNQNLRRLVTIHKPALTLNGG